LLDLTVFQNISNNANLHCQLSPKVIRKRKHFR